MAATASHAGGGLGGGGSRPQLLETLRMVTSQSPGGAGDGGAVGGGALDVQGKMEMSLREEMLAANESAERGGGTAESGSDREASKNLDPKSARRLAQNREAARKSRLRKKAYVQQLESSKNRLQQLESELTRLRNGPGASNQGPSSHSSPSGAFSHGGGGGGGGAHPSQHQQQLALLGGGAGGALAANGGGPGAQQSSGAAAFDQDYGRWVEEHHRLMCEMRSVLQTVQLGGGGGGGGEGGQGRMNGGALSSSENELRGLVDSVMAHYDELFRTKSLAVKSDVFHLMSGMWKTPAERCFLWIGGFRPSELLKILIPQIEPLSEQQLVSICNLQQSCQQAEDALSQGMEALQQSLADTLSAGSLGAASNVANYMGQMAMAMGKLGTLESFVRQADSLRQQTLQQMCHILSTRQSARGLLAMGDYFARLRALSSLWAARPRE